jgi:hypothetical protein
MILLQRLIGLLALLGLIWVIRKLFSTGNTLRAESRQATPVPDRSESAMVRDRVCNTFLPRSRALTLSTEQGEEYFCSERCRKIHQERLAG